MSQIHNASSELQKPKEQKKMGSMFDRLAFEIITEILLYVDLLTPVSRCSRRLYNIAEPLIYANVILDHPRSYTLFIRTVVSKPSVIRFVGRFHTLAHPYGFIYDLNFLTDADRAWVRSRLPDATYGKQICDEWFESMFFPAKVDWIDMPIYWDAITAFLLILFMPTLKSIRLSEYGWLVHGYRFLEMIFEKPRSNQASTWINLTKIHIGLCNANQETDSFHMPSLLPYIHIPSVTKLTLFASHPAALSGPSLAQPAQHIRDLTLTESQMTGRPLEQFLKSFHALKSFRYEYKWTTDAAPWISKGLVNSRNTLKELRVGKSPVGRDELYSWQATEVNAAPEKCIIGSLVQYHKLKFVIPPSPSSPSLQQCPQKKLDVDAIHLVSPIRYGLEPEEYILPSPYVFAPSSSSKSSNDYLHFCASLPPNLEYLNISNAHAGIVANLSSLFAKGLFLSQTTSLRELYLYFRHFILCVAPREEEMQVLRTVAGNTGVRVWWDRCEQCEG